ncbi:MAG TPA: hypothetical protein VE010_15855 [Thermoanaerobaculia bacterium]|nr:hypothetical protein [Thermoanaerobaculia bacterium]
MTEDAAAARAAFIAFVESLDRARRVLVLHDFDADGVTAGVVLQRALERDGFGDVVRVIPTRERDAWAEVNRALLTTDDLGALFVLDLGSRDEALANGSYAHGHDQATGGSLPVERWEQLLAKLSF